MIITLIGMSGAGKSHWSKRIEQEGFELICIDDIIEQNLVQLPSASGLKGLREITKWMGQPYEDQYRRTSEAYIDIERRVLEETLDELRSSPERDIVVDTPGSLCYMPDKFLRELVGHTIMVNFHTPHSAQQDMARQFLRDPKPLIWGDAFSREPGETPQQALARCYPRLLAYRTARYEQLAHVTLEYEQLRNPDMTAQEIITAAKSVAKVEVTHD